MTYNWLCSCTFVQKSDRRNGVELYLPVLTPSHIWRYRDLERSLAQQRVIFQLGRHKRKHQGIAAESLLLFKAGWYNGRTGSR
jgi:hypothetical protein